MPSRDHPQGEGVWTLLQDQIDRLMWQQDETDAAGGVITRFWVVNPPEELVYETFDEAEMMFEALAEDQA